MLPDERNLAVISAPWQRFPKPSVGRGRRFASRHKLCDSKRVGLRMIRGLSAPLLVLE
jgi:hypothetical protein